METWVCAQGSTCGICDVQRGTWTVFLQFSAVNIIPLLVHIHSFIMWKMNNVSIGSQFAYRHTLFPLQQKKLCLFSYQQWYKLYVFTVVCVGKKELV
jgi:hypothetical protein